MYVEELIKTTNAYKIISGEKKRDALSHAYLIVCPDGELIREYLKVFPALDGKYSSHICVTADGVKL